jgi:hypothetical protein
MWQPPVRPSPYLDRDIQQLIDKYYANPTYYCIKNLEELLESNCKVIRSVTASV